MNKRLTIAIQKNGRLSAQSKDLINKSGISFNSKADKLLAKSNQFSTSNTWDLILPSLSLRKLLSILSYTLTYLKIDQIEKKNKGHQVKLDNIEEDEMLFFIHKFVQ